MTVLLERDHELEVIAAVVDAARAGAGRALLVEGVAGAGKSALLAAAAERGVRILRATGGEWERDAAFGGVRQLIERVPLVRFTGAAAPAAGVIDPAGGAVEPGFVVLHAIYWLLAELADEAPLVLVVDDLHWVDDASLLALDHLARRLHDVPVSLVGALRPAEPGAPEALLDGLRQQPAVTVISPAPLSPDAVSAVVRGALPDADAAVCTAYAQASAGNPLYLQELLRSGPANGPEAIVSATLPTIGERIVRRVRRTSPAALALAGAAAVLGDQAALAVAIELAGLDPLGGRDVADQLVALGILALPDPPSFAHPVIRHSLYAQLPAGRRAELHRAAADALGDADAVAAHLSALPPSGSEHVATRLRVTAGEARARGAIATAVRRLERAVAEGAERPALPELLFDLGAARAVSRDAAAIPDLQQALALADGPLKREIALLLGELLGLAGEWDAAWSTLQEAGAGLTDDDPARLAFEATQAVLLANDAGRVGEFRAGWDRYEELSRRDAPAARALAGLLAFEAAARGDVPGQVLAHVERALAGGTLLTDPSSSWAVTQTYMALVAIDAHDQVDAVSAALRENARRSGSTWERMNGLVALTWTQARRGQLVAAEATAATFVDIMVETGLMMGITSLAMILGDLLVERPSALPVYRERLLATELPPAFAATASGAHLAEARARLALAAGDRAAARRDLRRAAQIYAALDIGPAWVSWRSLLALVAEHPEEARALLDEELALARAAENPRAIGVALRRRGDADSLREAVTVLERTPAALELAYARADLGALTGDAELLATSLADAERCGAERLRDRVADQLRHAGVMPPRRPAKRLTPAELRVARLAAAGHSNPAIGQELFISVKTVETHLSSAYAKLGLSGQGARAQLEAALRRRDTS